MKKTIFVAFALAALLGVAPLQAQTAGGATGAVVITDAAAQAKLKEMIAAKVQDDALRIIDAGDTNLGVFVIHLNPSQTPAEPVQLMSHNDVSEVYYVLKGEGILYHGGTMQNPTPRDLATTGGPSKGGASNGKMTQNVGPGDIFIIPANTPHQVNLGAKTEMVYLVVRVDPKKHLKTK